ncbi:Protein of unknown function [Thermobacillus xylanilyticus]|uniref:Uncharacterized protein n=1 Tax=Thermobacillus xylanilyticus TaxID=76633 RepID=A0ABN7RW20_THEXY|nr:Protein of unknown function [Thermobacillus xylanilyticus]
MTVMFPVVV